MYKQLLIAVEPAKSDKAICACQSARGEGDCDHRHRALDRSGLCDTAYPSMISTYEKSAAGDAANILNNAKQSAENVGIHQHAPDAIIKLAKEQKCDHVVVGSHGRGSLGRVLLGSTSLKVLSFSQGPVLVCH